jgi:hypothetical protein
LGWIELGKTLTIIFIVNCERLFIAGLNGLITVASRCAKLDRRAELGDVTSAGLGAEEAVSVCPSSRASALPSRGEVSAFEDDVGEGDTAPRDVADLAGDRGGLPGDAATGRGDAAAGRGDVAAGRGDVAATAATAGDVAAAGSADGDSGGPFLDLLLETRYQVRRNASTNTK